MSIQKWSDRIWVVRLHDDPAFAEDLDQINERALSPDMMPHLVLEFTAVTSIASSNLSAMLRLRKNMIDREVQLRLTSLPDGVWAVFLTTGLDKVFNFTHDTPTALAELQISA